MWKQLGDYETITIRRGQLLATKGLDKCGSIEFTNLEGNENSSQKDFVTIKGPCKFQAITLF